MARERRAQTGGRGQQVEDAVIALQGGSSTADRLLAALTADEASWVTELVAGTRVERGSLVEAITRRYGPYESTPDLLVAEWQARRADGGPADLDRARVAALLRRIVTDGGRWGWWADGWREHPALVELRALGVQVEASPTLLYGDGDGLDDDMVAQVLEELTASGHLRDRAGP